MSSTLCSMVNSLLGTKGLGNCLIGPYRPFGMVRLGPDSHFPHVNNGYQPGDAVSGFSHMHVSGTGGPPRYGHVLLMPFVGKPRIINNAPFIAVPFRNRSSTIPHDLRSEVGYFSCSFPPLGTAVALTCTQHVGRHFYQFTAQGPRHVLVDPAATLQGTCCPAGTTAPVEEWDSTSTCIGGVVQVCGPSEIQGRSDFRGGWGHDKPYSIFYYIRSAEPFTNVLLANQSGLLPSGMDASAVGSCRLVVGYGETIKSVQLEVGISYVSIAQARSHVAVEIGTTTFDETRASCVAQWEGWFRRFSLSGGTEDQQAIFYSLLYRMLCMPTDLGINKENPFWHSGVRQYTDWYCLWDSIRNANSLYHLFAPEYSADVMNALIDIAKHTGWLPDAHIAGHHAFQQSACAAEILFSEAQAKGIKGVDYKQALGYCVKNTTAVSPDVFVKGRFLDVYHSQGFLSTDVPKACVSRFIEYTYHDWCISRMASTGGDHGLASQLKRTSRNIWNLWREEKKSFWPRKPDGTWEEAADSMRPLPDVWNDPYTYEGPLVCWSFNALHDIKGLIFRMGGNQEFVKYLDWYFQSGLHQVKETRMHIPHLYTYAGRPDKAADAVAKTLQNSFHNTPDGLVDNEDMGCQSGYFIFNAMGLYPIYGQTHYMLVPPLFDRVEMALGKSGKTLTITADRGASTGRYISGVSVNGVPINRSWIEHAEIAGGGTVAFTLSDEVSAFGTKELPPNGL